MKSMSKRVVLALSGLALMGACAGGDDQPSIKSCFSPGQTPELAIDHPEAGCACNGEAAQCVSTSHDGQAWDVALVCTAGRWTSVEDGPCYPTPSAAQSCAEGTRRGESCLECGPTDGCLRPENTCLAVCTSNADCTDLQHPACVDGLCRYLCG